MEISLETLQTLAQLRPDTELTIDLFDGTAKDASQITRRDAQDMPMANLLFRSEVVRTLAQTLNLSDACAFLQELCSKLGIGPSTEEPCTSPLKSADLRQILTEVKSYALEKKELRWYVENNKGDWCDAEALRRVIDTADSSMLRAVKRDCLLAERAALKPYYQFAEQYFKSTAKETVTRLRYLEALAPKHSPRYGSGMLYDVAEKYKEKFCTRAAALMAAAELGRGNTKVTMATYMAEALDSVVKELRLTRLHHPKGDAVIRLDLLKALERVSPLQVPKRLSEVMRHQIITGDQGVLMAFQNAWRDNQVVSVPYPIGQGEQRVVSTSIQNQRIGELLTAAFHDAFSRAGSQEALIADALRGQGLDMARGVTLFLDGVDLKSYLDVGALRAAWENFMGVTDKSERVSLMAATMSLCCQSAFTQLLFGPVETRCGILGMFVIPNPVAKTTVMRIDAHREGDKVTLAVEHAVKKPYAAMDSGQNTIMLNENDERAYIQQKIKVTISMKDDTATFRVDEPIVCHYNLSKDDLAKEP